MKTFTDKKGRVWDLELDILTCRRVDASDFKEYYKPDFSIFSLAGDPLKNLVLKSPFTFAVIWAIIQPQAKEMFKKTNDHLLFPFDPDANPAEAETEFVSGINATAKTEANAAFLEALGDFFPELKTALSSLSRQMRNLSEKIEEKAKEVEPMLDQMLQADMDEGIREIRQRLQKTRGERLGEILSPSPQ